MFPVVSQELAVVSRLDLEVEYANIGYITILFDLEEINNNRMCGCNCFKENLAQ